MGQRPTDGGRLSRLGKIQKVVQKPLSSPKDALPIALSMDLRTVGRGLVGEGLFLVRSSLVRDIISYCFGC